MLVLGVSKKSAAAVMTLVRSSRLFASSAEGPEGDFEAGDRVKSTKS